MIVQGNHPIVGSVQEVWTHLMDPEVLERITPGITALNDLGNNKYQAQSKVKIGPVKGAFVGELHIRNKIENREATLVIDQKSKIGNVVAEIKIHLIALDEAVEINYKGEAKLSGKIALMGQRIIGGVISSLSKQFFNALDKEINP